MEAIDVINTGHVPLKRIDECVKSNEDLTRVNEHRTGFSSLVFVISNNEGSYSTIAIDSRNSSESESLHRKYLIRNVSIVSCQSSSTSISPGYDDNVAMSHFMNRTNTVGMTLKGTENSLTEMTTMYNIMSDN